MQATDEFKTIKSASTNALFKDKGSKFLGYAYPIDSEEEVAPLILKLKEQHHKARHWCFAWRIGTEIVTFRANDDGEPNNSAGQPIYGQILSFELTNILIVVVRYFGGTKLGVGGLIHAYKTAANLALQEAEIITKTIDILFELKFEYKDLNKVMRLIKENELQIIDQEMEMQCNFVISVRKNEADKIKKLVGDLRCVIIRQFN